MQTIIDSRFRSIVFYIAFYSFFFTIVQLIQFIFKWWSLGIRAFCRIKIFQWICINFSIIEQDNININLNHVCQQIYANDIYDILLKYSPVHASTIQIIWVLTRHILIECLKFNFLFIFNSFQIVCNHMSLARDSNLLQWLFS